MSEIPDDVHLAIRALKNGAIDLAKTEGVFLSPDQVLARAILAERERCAKIAEHLNGWGSDCGRGGHAMHIAKCIRTPSTGEEQ